MNFKRLISLFIVLIIFHSCNESRKDILLTDKTKRPAIFNSDTFKTDSLKATQQNTNYGLTYFSRSANIKDWQGNLINKYKVKSIKIYKSIANETAVLFADTVSYTYFNKFGLQVKDSLKNISVKYFNYENDKLTINEVKGDYLATFIYSSDSKLLEESFYEKRIFKSRINYVYKDTTLIEINTFDQNNIKTNSTIYEFEVRQNGWSKKIVYDDEIFDTYDYDSYGRLINSCGHNGNVIWCSSHHYDTLKNKQIEEIIEIGGNGGRQSEPTIHLYNSEGQIIHSKDNENRIEENYTYDKLGRLIGYSELGFNDKIFYEEIHSYDNYLD